MQPRLLNVLRPSIFSSGSFPLLRRPLLVARRVIPPRPRAPGYSRRFSGYPGPSPQFNINRTLIWSFIAANVGVNLLWHYVDYADPHNRLRNIVRVLLNRLAVLHSDRPIGPSTLGSIVSDTNTMHVAFNMINFWGVARVFAFLPPSQMSLLFVGSGLAGNLLWWKSARQGPGPLPRESSTPGASGAISGIIVAAAMLIPRAPVRVIAIPLPMWTTAPLYMLVDIYGWDTSNTRAVSSVGGALFGAAFYTIFLRRFGGVFKRPFSAF